MYQKQNSQKPPRSPRARSVSKEITATPSYGSLSSVVQRAQEEPSQVSDEVLQQLDSAIGTRATGQIFARKPTPWMPSSKGIPTELWGNVREGLAPIQTKLTIGATGDKYEQEADRVAANVVEQINRPARYCSQGEMVQGKELSEGLGQRSQPIVQRLEAIGGREASGELSGAINRARGGGQPLFKGLQESMGQAMGADFSGVRVHTDAQADQLNVGVGARAFTTGQDMFFKGGAYQPGSRGGQELIAHELTHVVQQNGGGRDSTIQRETDGVLNPMVLLERVIAAIRDRGDEEEATGIIDESFNLYSTQDMRKFYGFLPESYRYLLSRTAKLFLNENWATDAIPGHQFQGKRIVPIIANPAGDVRERRPGDKIMSSKEVPEEVSLGLPPHQLYYMTNISQYPYISRRMYNYYDIATRNNDGEKDVDAWEEYIINDKVIAEHWLEHPNDSGLFGIYVSQGGMITPVLGPNPRGDAHALGRDKRLGNGDLVEGHPLHVGAHMTMMNSHPRGQVAIHKHFDAGSEWKEKVEVWVTKAEKVGGFLSSGKIGKPHTKATWHEAQKNGEGIRASLGLRFRQRKENPPGDEGSKKKKKK